MKTVVSCSTDKQAVLLACQRVYPLIEDLNASLPKLKSQPKFFVMSFVDEDDGLLRKVRSPKDFLEFEVGYDIGRLDGSSNELVEYVALKLQRCVDESKLPTAVQQQLRNAIAAWAS